MSTQHEPSEDLERVMDLVALQLNTWAENVDDCVTSWRVLGRIAETMGHARDMQLLEALEHGHTQAEFARATSVSKQSMHQKVTGARRRLERHHQEHRDAHRRQQP